MINSKYISKDQDYQNEKTTYWFEITGYDDRTGVDFEDYKGELFGIAENSDGSTQVLDNDGAPLTEGDALATAVRRTAVVTDPMREDY